LHRHRSHLGTIAALAALATAMESQVWVGNIPGHFVEAQIVQDLSDAGIFPDKTKVRYRGRNEDREFVFIIVHELFTFIGLSLRNHSLHHRKGKCLK
jgi:hypothetical protein